MDKGEMDMHTWYRGTLLSSLSPEKEGESGSIRNMFNPRNSIVENSLASFILTDVTDDTNFAVQCHNGSSIVKEMENNLRSRYGDGDSQGQGQDWMLTPADFEEQMSLCAFYYGKYGRWVRGMITESLEAFDKNMRNVKVRMLDYGIWDVVFINYTDPSTLLKFRQLPLSIAIFPPQGMTASQYCCPIVQNVVSEASLRKAKGSVILTFVKEYKFPNAERDVPHVSLALLDSVKSSDVDKCFKVAH